jgi:hypothetical protein
MNKIKTKMLILIVSLFLSSCLPGPQKVDVIGIVWHDSNGDGKRQPSENGIPGISVELIQYSEVSSSIELGIRTTDQNGEYRFDDIGTIANFVEGETVFDREIGISVNFSFTENTFAKYFPMKFTIQHEGDFRRDASTSNHDSDAFEDLLPGKTSFIFICIQNRSCEEETLQIDAGMTVVDAIAGFVWNDLNQNGIMEDQEPRIKDHRVRLFDSVSTEIDETRTNGDGFYFFAAPAGEYQLKFDLPPGEDFTLKDKGNMDSIDSDVNPNSSQLLVGWTDVFSHKDPAFDIRHNVKWNAGLLLASDISLTPSPEPTETPGNNPVEIGFLLIDDGDCSGALEQFRAALAIDNRNDMAHYGRALVAKCQGDDDKEESSLLSFLEFHPEQDELRNKANERLAELQAKDDDGDGTSDSSETPILIDQLYYEHTVPGEYSTIFLRFWGPPDMTYRISIAGPDVIPPDNYTGSSSTRSFTYEGSQYAETDYSWKIRAAGTYRVSISMGSQIKAIDIEVLPPE